jgi:hypothetical protein
MRVSSSIVIAVLCACQPNPKAPVTIMAMLVDNTNKLAPKQTQLQTVSSVVNLKGTVGDMVGGAVITVDPAKSLNGLSDQQVADTLYSDRGGDVRADLIDKSGTLWPADFHSWNMVTAYWNFEQAYLYFMNVYNGAPTDDLPGARILYWVDYEDLSIGDPAQQKLVNNALYDSRVQAFMLAPYDQNLQAVPIPMNLGIIGHEYSHRVFNHKVFGGAALPNVGNFNGEGLNIIKSMDEGFADFHGYGVTCTTAGSGPGCETAFLGPSFGDDPVVKARDFSLEDKCMTVDLRTAIATLPSDTFVGEGQQYKLGTIFAASLYQAANKGGKVTVMQQALVAAYNDDSNATPGFNQFLASNLASPQNLTLEKVADIILSHITDPDLKRLACNEMWERLNLTIPSPDGSITHCPPTSMRGSMNCPVLP